MQLNRVLSIASLAVGVLFYLVGLSGFLWPKTPATDVGLVSTSVLFILFGAVGWFATSRSTAA